MLMPLRPIRTVTLERQRLRLFDIPRIYAEHLQYNFFCHKLLSGRYAECILYEKRKFPLPSQNWLCGWQFSFVEF